MRYLPTALVLGLLAGPVRAQERDYCPSRPGLGTTPCTISPGRVSLETAVADWTRDETPDERQDTLLIGDTLARIGLTDAIEAQVGWTPFGHVRVRTRGRRTGIVDTANRVGDVLVGMKANLRHPDGSGFSLAVQPFAILPVGRPPVGAGDWSAGLVLPMSYDLDDTLNLQFTPEADAATDDDGSGRHLAYSATVGLGVALGDAVSATAEVQALRDRDPAGRTTQLLGALSMGWMPSDDLQFDIGGTVGLDRAAPDVELYFGVSRRF